ncbi:uncharacterized protein KGF55_001691 [Candida pseudojiufengensis]|uniref:uncharacterized protein n=1 Tax=Candida pseudojiufengensis TaxID=497109 RepID=UPI002224C19A|nr:uncharacterized protein KGF55_001691 [Candida pseudojiufengensis]KAI5964622.1 hypothetical protein KGF55_001691 [Candida pseudojiufengensis]
MFLSVRRFLQSKRFYSHENPLNLPRRGGSASIGSKGLPIRQKIPNVQNIILISSAKGGVGKSTVSANTALALQKLGKRVGLLDVDIFGPSIPKLMNLKGEPRISQTTGKLLPMINYGIQTMSMGYLVKDEQAVVWRGLMVMKAIQQLLFDVEWAPVDYLIIDMPPGTGDTQLSISQLLKVSGAVIVTTPQDIALIDAVKGIAMYNKVHIPIVGIVQNMSYYICPNCNHESHVFRSNGAEKLAHDNDVKIIADIPLNENICLQSDLGKPIVVSDPDGEIARKYYDIARSIISFEISQKNGQ